MRVDDGAKRAGPGREAGEQAPDVGSGAAI
jgi:hypothetical protein